MVYIDKTPAQVPEGQVIVHNNVRPAKRQGARGFRFWLQVPDDRLEVCACGWAASLPQHYRIKPVLIQSTRAGDQIASTEAAQFFRDAGG